MCTNQGCRSLVPREPVSTQYFFYVIDSCGAELNVRGKGTTFLELSGDELARFPIPVPPIDEQIEIANFLDCETAKIDALVAEQERLIELLTEKRHTVISHAVTKGLNPDTPMKPSGIDWAGEVPRHWPVGALRYYARLGTGGTPDRAVPGYWDGETPWVKTGELDYSVILQTDERISVEGLAACSAKLLPRGTLLMALYGQGATRGRVATLGLEAACNQACAAIEPDSRLNGQFLSRFFEAGYPFIRDAGNVTTQMNLSLEYVSGLKITVPPLSEQREIAHSISEGLHLLQLLTSDVRAEISLLTERRSAVISAAVTGQIDVRHWVPDNPAAII